jgi:hypothetical protein
MTEDERPEQNRTDIVRLGAHNDVILNQLEILVNFYLDFYNAYDKLPT